MEIHQQIYMKIDHHATNPETETLNTEKPKNITLKNVKEWSDLISVN